MSRLQLASQRGFTFIEMLAAMGILMFILFAAYNVIDTNQRIAVHQEEIAEMDANARTGLDLATNEIREAGANPMGYPTSRMIPAAEWVTIESDPKMNKAVDVRTDLNGDGDSQDPNEYVRYEWLGTLNATPPSVADLVRTADNGDGVINGSDSAVTLASNVKQAKRTGGFDNIFDYYDKDGTAITVRANVPTSVRRVKMQFAVQSSKPDRVSRRYKEVTLRQEILLRNLRRNPAFPFP